MIDISDDITIARINGSVQRGGWECVFTSMLDTDRVEVNQRFAVQWRSMFGGSLGPLRTAFRGFVAPQQADFDQVGSRAQFIARTSDMYLERGWLQGLGLADIHDLVNPFDNRANYHQWGDTAAPSSVPRLTMGLIIEHILGYYDAHGTNPATNPDWVAHTNLVFHATENPHGWITLDGVETSAFADPANLDGSMRVNRINIRETNNMWSRMREDIAAAEFFVLYFDKDDTLHYNKHPMFLSGALPTPVMTFDESFVASPPIVEDRGVNQVRQVRLHAVTDEGDTLHSAYPTSPTFVYGTVEEMSRLRCNSQDQLDNWAETQYDFINRDYTVRWVAPGLCGLLFEILDRVQITYTGTTANGVHIDWTEKKFWIHDITVTPTEQGFTGTTEFILEAEN